MTIAIPPALNSEGKPATAATTATPAALSTSVKHMVGMLWYEMLSELNKTGLSTDSLGTGSDSFQSMMLWNVAQNDFGKYDTGLTTAAIAQLGGKAGSPPTDNAASIGTTGFSIAPEAMMPVAASSGIMGAIAGIDPMGDAGAASPAVEDEDQEAAAPPAGSLAARAVSFARAVWPGVQQAAAQLGVPAIGLLAQTALETNWGTAAPGNNLFGIKAPDGENGTSRATTEMVDGVMVPQTATFRDYASPAQSLSGYVDLIGSAYHNVVGQSTVTGFAAALQSGGYATDKNYAAKIVSVSQSPMMALVLQTIGQTQAGSN